MKAVKWPETKTRESQKREAYRRERGGEGLGLDQAFTSILYLQS